MPAERGYETQTMPSAAPMGPERDPREFGAGIGQALQQAGGVVHETEIRAFKIEKQLDQDRQVAEWGKRFALHKQNMDGISRDARATAQPGGMGHGQRIRETNEAARETLLQGIDDPVARRLAEKQLTDYDTALYGQEGDWEEAQRAAKVVGDRQMAGNAAANRVRFSDDPKVYATELQAGLDQNAALNVAPDVRDKLDKWTMSTLGLAFLQGVQDKNPEMVEPLLRTGEFDFLDPGTVNQLLAGADVEIERNKAKEKEAERIRQAQQKEDIETLKKRHSQNLPVDDADWDMAIKAARDSGDESGATELEGMKAESRFVRIYQGQSPVQMDQALSRLKAVKKPTDDQLREIRWLEDNRANRAGQFDSDPVGWVIANGPPGSAPPAGDITDPNVARARVGWSRTMARAYGRPDFPILSKAEASQMGEIRASGSDGELRVLQWIDKLPDDRSKMLAARQIAPDDKTFHAMAQITPNSRAVVRNGRKALAANGKFLDPDQATRGGRERIEMVGKLDNDLNIALRYADGQSADTMRTTAREFTAGLLWSRGHNGNMVTRGDYTMGLRVALGGAVKYGPGRSWAANTGGLMYWQDYPVALPSEMVATKAEEVGGIRSFGSAVADDIRQRKEWPVNGDNTPADLRYIRPVLLKITYNERGVEVWHYRWEDRSRRVVQSSKGGDFISRIENR